MSHKSREEASLSCMDTQFILPEFSTHIIQTSMKGRLFSVHILCFESIVVFYPAPLAVLSFVSPENYRGLRLPGHIENEDKWLHVSQVEWPSDRGEMISESEHYALLSDRSSVFCFAIRFLGPILSRGPALMVSIMDPELRVQNLRYI